MKQSKPAKLTKEEAEQARIAELREYVPIAVHDFIKKFIPAGKPFPATSDVLSGGLLAYKKWLDGCSDDALQEHTKYTLLRVALKRIARRVLTQMSHIPRKRDAVISTINTLLKLPDKMVGENMNKFVSTIAEQRKWESFPVWDVSGFTKEFRKKLKDIPVLLLKQAVQDYEDWAVHAGLAEHLLLNDKDIVTESDGSEYNVAYELVLLNLVRRVLATVPAGRKRDEFVAACNAHIKYHTPATGEVLKKLAKEAKELKSKDEAKKNERATGYWYYWSCQNMGKDDGVAHDKESYKDLLSAKERLWADYTDLRDEKNAGGGDWDYNECKISIDDDCMKFSASGLVEAEYEIIRK